MECAYAQDWRGGCDDAGDQARISDVRELRIEGVGKSGGDLMLLDLP
jgi:hypothetical protein